MNSERRGKESRFDRELFFRFFRSYIADYSWWFVGGLAALAATNWLSVSIPWYLGRALDQLGKGGAHKEVLFYALIIAGMGIGVIVIRTLSRLLFFTPGRLVEYRLRNDLFYHLLEQPQSFYARRELGDIISRVSEDVGFVRVMVGFGSLQIFNITLALLLTGTQMLRISWKLTLVALLPILIGLLFLRRGIEIIFEAFRESRKHLADISESSLATIQGIQTIQGFRAEEAFSQRYFQKGKNYLNSNLRLASAQAVILPLLPLSGAVSIGLLLFFGGPLVKEKIITVGQLVAFTTYISYLLFPLRSLGWLVSVFQRGYTSLTRVYQLLDAPPERPELPNPLKLPDKPSAPKIEVTGLTFAYPQKPDSPVLQNIRLEIPPGSFIGIFGRTGAGKTTLLRVLARIYNPPKGTVLIEGKDILRLDLYHWRDQLAYVPQSPFLFSQSIRENIVMGREYDSEKLEKVLELAALKSDLESMPEGLDTQVGERGIMLSGGQRQRITLARALYGKFRILLLDDIISAVDQGTEEKIISTLLELRNQTPAPTIILVSHRLSAFRHTDKIAVLDGGKLLQVDTHQNLIREPGPYREAWIRQK